MRVEGVTRVATDDAQVPEFLAGLDVCVGQPFPKLGANAIQFFVRLETGTDLR